ncbi:hypothetical protein ABLV96_08210 [Staphylococcus equorum]
MEISTKDSVEEIKFKSSGSEDSKIVGLANLKKGLKSSKKRNH